MNGIVAGARRALRRSVARQVWTEVLAEHQETLRQRDLIGRLLLRARLRPLVAARVEERLREWRRRQPPSVGTCW
ncbi:MAG: hypothetical protein AB7O97_23355 [Planctomycetota bacterium]